MQLGRKKASQFPFNSQWISQEITRIYEGLNSGEGEGRFKSRLLEAAWLCLNYGLCFVQEQTEYL